SSMARKRAAKPSTINRVAHSVSAGLERYCRGLDDWPRSWMGWEKDLPPGEKLVGCFRRFVEYLVSSDISRKTIQQNVDSLCVMGGEIIRDVKEDSSLRKRPVNWVLRDALHEDGGWLIHTDSEEEQRSFDSTCRKFHRFLLTQEPRTAARGKKTDAIKRLMQG